MNEKTKTVVTWVLSIALAALFLIGSLPKLMGEAVAQFADWGYASWFSYLIGAAELAGALGLLIPKLARWAALGLIVVMLGAAYTHISNAEGMRTLVPVAFALALGFVAKLRS